VSPACSSPPASPSAVALGVFRPIVLVPARVGRRHAAVNARGGAGDTNWPTSSRVPTCWRISWQRLVETLLFYPPGGSVGLSNRIRQERELCCDALGSIDHRAIV